MKKLLLLASAVALPFLATSCSEYASYGVATVGAPVVANPGFVGGGLAPLQVGFVGTTFNQWAYDPFRRAYFDRRVGRYWDPRIRGYCAVAPRRFASPIYPTGFRRGRPLACPAFLPRANPIARRGGVFGRPVGLAPRTGRFAPVVHGVSRGSARVQDFRRGDARRGESRRSGYSNAPRYRGGDTRDRGYQSSRYNAPVPSRGATTRDHNYRSSRDRGYRDGSNGASAMPRRSTGSTPRRATTTNPRYQTISTDRRRGSATRSAPEVRTAPAVRSSSYQTRSRSIANSGGNRRSYQTSGVSGRSSGYSRRSTGSTPRRAMTTPRQRTR